MLYIYIYILCIQSPYFLKNHQSKLDLNLNEFLLSQYPISLSTCNQVNYISARLFIECLFHDSKFCEDRDNICFSQHHLFSAYSKTLLMNGYRNV